jgi:hypothetical protein
MFQSKRKILIVLVVMFAASGVQAKEWLDEMLVHRAPAFTGENPENCLVCHSGERMRSIADGAHGNTKDNRAPFGNNGCESCHGPASIHVSRAHGGKGFPPLIGFGYTKVASPRDQQVDRDLFVLSPGTRRRRSRSDPQYAGESLLHLSRRAGRRAPESGPARARFQSHGLRRVPQGASPAQEPTVKPEH